MTGTTETCDFIRVSQAAKKLGVARQTALRYAVKGLSVNGVRVKLRVLLMGGVMKTKQEWIDAFLEAQSNRNEPAAVPAPTGRAPTPNDAEEDAREARLRDRLGF